MSSSLNTIVIFITKTNMDKNQVPKSLSSFFLISQLCFGMNFGFSVILNRSFSWKIERLSNAVTVIYILILVIPCFLYPYELWCWEGAIEFTLYIFILYISKYSVYNLIVDINEMYELKSNEKYILLAMCSFTEVMVLIKGYVIFIDCKYEGICYLFISPVLYLFYCLPYFGLDFVAQTQALIYFYIYCYVKDVKKSAETDLNINLLEKRYKNIAKIYDKIKPLYNKLVLEQLIIGVPKMMATLWSMLYYIQHSAELTSYINQFLFTTHIVLQIILPAIFAEMIKAEVDATKLILNEYLMSSTDERRNAKVSRLLKYMQARPLHHLVCRVVPVDARLLLSLFSLCTTYFIVILQFTHLYD